jgi:hypothetical protein
MSISLKESRVCAEIAKAIYDFLPGSGSSKWRSHVTFGSVAGRVGVGHYWQGGSKEPAIARLLELTLEHRRECFEPLILNVVKEGIKYRQRNGRPIREDEIKVLNGLIVEVGFKFPTMWDPSFLASLRQEGTVRAADRFDQELQSERLKAGDASMHFQKLGALRDRFMVLAQQADRQAAGRELQEVLTGLFAHFDLAPREPFRVVGEEIDGSFDLDNEVYLLEAKWEKSALSEAPLLVFREKIAGKSQFTRGLLIAINGCTPDALTAIHRGKQPNFILMEGYDLMTILQGQVRLDELLRAKVRHLAEEGEIFYSVQNLLASQGGNS